MTIRYEEALNERINNLADAGLNGLNMVLVTLVPDVSPNEAVLELHFHNGNQVADILADPSAPHDLFPIRGGFRIRAGELTGEVKVTAINAGPTSESLLLTVAPIGDYSTYTLTVNFANMDPLLNELPFKFRPGCFNVDCAPGWEPAPTPVKNPVIDYLAKDYDSFKHTMISAMQERVSGWQPTSEADLDQVLMELFSAAADELSDFQDRVMNEAYLGTARKRVSLARHARLMDYHIHQGNQAETWLAVKVVDGQVFDLTKGTVVWSGDRYEDPASVVFMSQSEQRLHFLLNDLSLYTWSGSIPTLAAGSTQADIKSPDNSEAAANEVRDLFRSGLVNHLLIQEHLNPETGEKAGRDTTRRQVLKLLAGKEAAEVGQDPLSGEWYIRVYWREEDKLKHNYCFTINCPPPKGETEDVSLFHGNLVKIAHGQPKSATFREAEEMLGLDEYHYDRTAHWGAVCRIPDDLPAYKATEPGGEVPPESTLQIEVEYPDGSKDAWDEVISLVHSDSSAENGDRYVVETDEEQRSIIRFGNGVNGRALPQGSIVHCNYQVGHGPDGNVGSDSLVNAQDVRIAETWNPFDVTNGRAPEPVAEIIRRVPEAYRYRQLRAVTLQDYVNRTEELGEVSRAAARYVWTGSWRAVRIAVDPTGTTEFTTELRQKVASHLNAVRLIGEDLEIRPPRFIPLEIGVSLCIQSDYWPEDIEFILEQEFSEGFTPDGRRGFFHADDWTFGQELRASQIIGRVQQVRGVDHVITVSMKRWDDRSPKTADVLEVAANEIIRVRNNPDHMEEGYIDFNIQGGRQ